LLRLLLPLNYKICFNLILQNKYNFVRFP